MGAEPRWGGGGGVGGELRAAPQQRYQWTGLDGEWTESRADLEGLGGTRLVVGGGGGDGRDLGALVTAARSPSPGRQP